MKDKEKVKLYNKKYYQKNKEREKQRAKDWYKNNPDKVKARSRRYLESHKDSVYLKTKEWRNRNKEHIKEYNRKYKEEYVKNHREDINKRKLRYYYSKPEYFKNYRRERAGKINAHNKKRETIKKNRFLKCANINKINEIYKQAHKMSKETGIPHDVDHIVPLQGKYVSGFHVEWNLQIIPSRENAKKHNQFPLMSEVHFDKR